MTTALAAVGANSSLAYVQETSFGVTPPSPSPKTLRALLGSKFDLTRTTFASKEMNSARQVMALTYGNRDGKGSVPIEFSYGSYDDLLEACMGGTWTTNVLKIGNTKRSFTVEQRWPDINLSELNTGTVITGMSLSVKPNAVVTGSFDHQFKDQTSVQMYADGVQTIAFDGTAKTLTRATGSFITDGFAVGDSVAITGAATSANNTTIVITTLTATVMTASAATLTTDTAKTGVTLAKTLGTPAAADTNPKFDSFTGTLSEGGNPLAIVTGIDFKLAQTVASSNVLFDPTIQQVSLGTVSVTGTLVVRFINNAVKAKFLSGTTSDLSFQLGATSKMYQFDMSKVCYTSATTDSVETELTQTLAFQAIYNATDATSLMITRTP
ncbi:MAG: phage tail tube protein [Acidithiobacillus sp.]|nr:phage tail tube protein [Acidithiobacillus sp.]